MNKFIQFMFFIKILIFTFNSFQIGSIFIKLIKKGNRCEIIRECCNKLKCIFTRLEVQNYYMY